MKTKLTLLSALTLMLFTGSLLAQDVPDWAWKTPMSKVYATGEYYNLPLAQDQVNYQNPNTTTRFVSVNGQDFILPPNVRPFPHTATQSEVDATMMGGNTGKVYASWNSYGPSFFGCGFALTVNNGASWTGSNVTTSSNSGDPGAWIWPTGSTWAGRLGLSYIQGYGYSTNDGTTWVHAGNFSGGSSFDKNLSAIDDIPGSPFFGRAYTVWTYFSNNRIYIAYTTDGGVTHSAGVPISPVPSAGHHHQGCDVAVGPGGVVYVVWGNCTTNGQNSTEDFLGFTKSTDGGVTWTGTTDNAVDINGIRSASLFNGIRANGFPRLEVDHTGGSRNGWIYAVLSEKTIAPATDVADMCLCRSTNGGTTWTHTRINQDAPGNGKHQYMGDVAVASDGSVCVSYYDQRNTTSPVTQYWMSRSLDGGNTWADVQVSDHNFTPAPIPGLAGGYQGDYTSITTGTGKVWPFWADNSSGIYQVWTEGIIIGPQPANDISVGPFLSYPSSFAPSTNYTIRARVTNGGTNAQTNIPIRFSVNGVLQTTNTITNLPVGGSDSSSFTWNSGAVGVYTLRIYSGLAVDENRANDTVTGTANVNTSTFGPGSCSSPLPYTPITGTAGPSGDDVTTTVPIGFTVNYQGTPYTQISICTNGFCILGSSTFSAFTNDLCPNFPMLAGFWDDLLPTAGQIVYTTIGTAPNRTFVVQYTNVPYFSGSGNVTMQIRLHEGGGSGDCFDFIYGPCTANAGASGSIGITRSPGNSGNIISVTAGSSCGTSSFSTTTCNNNNTWVMTTGQMYKFGTCGVTGIGNNNNNVPNQYFLSQNYPNPFNPSTKISYGLPKAGNLKLVVYDLLGQEVATLVNEFKQAGSYDITFDASNMASGVYFYKIEAGDFSDIKRMMLVK